jgi:menaquinone-dependent protoporphyrinogen oxidase
MLRFLVLFGTTDGHSAKVAQAIGDQLRIKGHRTDVADAKLARPTPDDFDAVFVVASVHARGYQRPVVDWVSRHADALNGRPTAFVSVCLGVLQHDPAVDRELQSIVDNLLRSAAWRPVETKIVAGALKYTQYNFLKRWVMKRIARKAGGDTDTARDYEYTDWTELADFVDRFARRLERPADAAPAVPPATLDLSRLSEPQAASSTRA